MQEGKCRLIVVASGGRSGLLQMDLGSQRAAESTFVKVIEQYREQGGYAHVRCSTCGATYTYTRAGVRAGKATCQNCGRVITETTDENTW